MSLAGFTRIGEATLPTLAGSHTDFVMVLKWADFHADVLADLDDGGGDLRFSSDAAGTTQLACHVISFDKTGTNAVVKVKVPSASTGTVVHVWGDNTGATQPAVTDTYGRNATYSDSAYFFELDEAANTTAGGYENSTGGSDGTGVSMSLANVAGPYDGDFSDFANSPDEITAPFSTVATEFTISFWASPDSLAEDQRAVSFYESPATIPIEQQTIVWMDSGGSSDGWAAFQRTSDGTGSKVVGTDSSDATVSTWQYVSVYISSSTLTTYVDSVQGDTDGTLVSNGISNCDTLSIGRAWAGSGNGNYFDGGIGAVNVREGDYTSYLADEYDNQSAAGAWVTMTAVGGGPTTYTGTVAVTAQSSTASATGDFFTTLSGTAAVQSQSATALATGDFYTSFIGTSASQAQSATASGVGISSSAGTWAGMAAVQSQSATVSGTGLFFSTLIGTGAAQAQTATVAGVGDFFTVFVGTGDVDAQAATVSGVGAVEGTQSGSGAVQSQSATVSGTGTGSYTNTFTGTANLVIGGGTCDPDEIATAVLSSGDVDGYTVEQSLRVMMAALAGPLSGAASTTVTINAVDDSKSRIVATVDSNGNRTSVTLDGD